MTNKILTRQQAIELGQSYNLAHNKLNIKFSDQELIDETKRLFNIKQTINEEVLLELNNLPEDIIVPKAVEDKQAEIIPWGDL